jgi:hypothetical protein
VEEFQEKENSNQEISITQTELDFNHNVLLSSIAHPIESKTTKNKRKQLQPKQTRQHQENKTVNEYEPNVSNEIRFASPTSTTINTYCFPSSLPDMLMYDFSLNNNALPNSNDFVVQNNLNVVKKVAKAKKVRIQENSELKATPRKAKALPEEATNIMKKWYTDHSENPYPNDDERREMAQMGCISENQVKAWFANKRNRSNNTRPKKRTSLSESHVYDQGLNNNETNVVVAKKGVKKKINKISCKQTQVEQITSTTTQFDHIYNSNSNEGLSPFTNSSSPSTSSSLSCTSANQHLILSSPMYRNGNLNYFIPSFLDSYFEIFAFFKGNSILVNEMADLCKINPNQFINDGSSNNTDTGSSDYSETVKTSKQIENIFFNDEDTQSFSQPRTYTLSPFSFLQQYNQCNFVNDDSFGDDTEFVPKINYSNQLIKQLQDQDDKQQNTSNNERYNQHLRNDTQSIPSQTSQNQVIPAIVSNTSITPATNDYNQHNQQYICETPPPIRYTNGPNVTQYNQQLNSIGSSNNNVQLKRPAISPSPIINQTMQQYSIADMISLPSYITATNSNQGTQSINLYQQRYNQDVQLHQQQQQHVQVDDYDNTDIEAPADE